MAEKRGRQLALAALAGQATDAVPVTLFTWGYDYCWQCLGIEPWQLACGSNRIRLEASVAAWERHKPDVVIYDMAGCGEKEPTLLGETFGSWFVRDENSGCEYEFIKASFTLVDRATGAKTCDPVPGLDTREDVDRLVGSGPYPKGHIEGLADLIRTLGDEALVLPTCTPGYISACYGLGFEKAMAAMVDDPDFFFYLADRLAESDEERMRQYADAGAEAVYIADGWASCDIISPGMFRRFALPYQRRTVEAVKKAGMRAILWNEGDIRPILKDEFELPLDALAFEQPRKGIDLTVEKVREAIGPDRCLFGNLDSELLLGRNDPEEIRQAVWEQIRQSGKGAPFILSCGSPLPSDTPPSAVDAMIQAAREFEW